MSKGSGRRPQRVGQDVMADNWMGCFGDKWECRDAAGKVLSEGSTHDSAIKKALAAGYDGFAILKVRG